MSDMRLTPALGFNWFQVAWGAPDQVRTLSCSYCDKPIGDDDVPLILWRIDHWCAEFCVECQRRWWGMEIFDDGDDEAL